MTNIALREKPGAGNPRARFDEGEEVASSKPRSLLYKNVCVVGLSCAFAICGITHKTVAQEVKSVAQPLAVTHPTVGQSPASAQVAPASAPAAASAAQTTEVKAMPGAVLMVFKGNDLAEAELTSFVDKGKAFDSHNADGDPSARSVNDRTSRWTGILNVDQPGLYTFNATAHVWGDSRWSVTINGVPVLAAPKSATMSKNVQLPGPVNIEIVMHSVAARQDNSLLLRFKKAGTLTYRTITPETLYHTAE